MLKVPCYHPDGRFAELLEIDETAFGSGIHRIALKSAVVAHLANQRQGNASSRERSEIAGARRKPWAQKHTGRARAGAPQSSIWVGGGKAHGPKPRDYRQYLPQKVRQLARASAVLSRLRDGAIAAITSFAPGDPPKTKAIAQVLRKIGRGPVTWLIGTAGPHAALYRAVRNLPGVQCLPVQDWNAYAVLRARRVLLTRTALDVLTGKAPATTRDVPVRAGGAV